MTEKRGSGPSEPKSHGTYHLLYEDVHSHPKTLRLARALSALRPGLSADDMVDTVVAQLHRLGCWCARESETGAVAHLTPAVFASILRWRVVGTEDEFWGAWMGSGFIDDPDTDDATVHEWMTYAGSLVRDRERKRASRAKAKSVPTRPRTVRGQSGDSPRTSRARVRKAESGKRKLEEEEPRSARSRSPAGESRPAPEVSPAGIEEAVAVADPPEPTAAPVTRRVPTVGARAAPSHTRASGKAPTSEWVDRWQAHRERLRLPGRMAGPDVGILLKRLSGLWSEWGGDAQASLQVCQVIDEWWRSPYGDRVGYGVRVFVTGSVIDEIVLRLTRHSRNVPRQRTRAEERLDANRIAVFEGIAGVAPGSMSAADALAQIGGR